MIILYTLLHCFRICSLSLSVKNVFRLGRIADSMQRLGQKGACMGGGDVWACMLQCWPYRMGLRTLILLSSTLGSGCCSAFTSSLTLSNFPHFSKPEMKGSKQCYFIYLVGIKWNNTFYSLRTMAHGRCWINIRLWCHYHYYYRWVKICKSYRSNTILLGDFSERKRNLNTLYEVH